MIAGLPAPSTLPDLANGATASVEVSALAPTSSAAPFDFILALEALAASAAEQQAAATAVDTAGLEATGLPELEDGIDTDVDVDEDLEEGALGFLAGLLNTAPRVVDRVSGAGMQAGAAPPDSVLVAPDPSAAKDAAGNPGGPVVAGSAQGAGAGAAAVLVEMSAEQAAAINVDAGADSTESSVEPMRANELLTQASRPTHTPGGQAAITTHVRDPRWAEDFGTRITTMVRGGESQAALQLTPVDLGPVDVTVTVRDSQATIHFGAAQADTRALIEASLPKLREMLAAQGFNLLDASVSQGFTQQGRPETAGVPRLGFEPGGEIAEPVRVTHAAGLLDLYA